MELSPQQNEAMARVQEWYKAGSHGSAPTSAGEDGSVFRLFGYAGTGKTTLARYIVESLGVEPVRYAAYTGKAAHVLRSKGAEDASTIHSLIYQPKNKARDKLRTLREELDRIKYLPASVARNDRLRALESAIRTEEERLASPHWLLKTPQESILTGSKLLVVDEVSMVGRPMAEDLLGFGVPILALGDPAQLPPVDGGGYFVDVEPDSLLTEVHRSALDSPVTRIATTVRSARPGQRGYGVVDMDGESGRIRDLPVGALPEFDQVLVGTNRTRWDAISMLRELAGLLGNRRARQRPVPGDRVIVLANNGEAEVLNGQLYTVEDAEYSRDRHELLVTGEDGQQRELPVWSFGFVNPDGERQARLTGTRGEVAAATFGQAITVHKAQGSQWRSVLVIDESHVFERMARGGLAARYQAGQRWLYTACTRASDRVVITGTGSVRD